MMWVSFIKSAEDLNKTKRVSSGSKRKTILKLLWNYKRPQISNTILSKNKRPGGITLPDLKLHYKVTVIQTLWYWNKNRPNDQWNTTESPEINPCFYGQLNFIKGTKIYNGERTVSSTNVIA